MIKNKCISVTDLRLNTKECLANLKSPKYIFVNNKPIAVIMDIDFYESEFNFPTLEELDSAEITPKMKKSLQKAKKTKKSELISL
jgi:PHD/YefM family antitoxin component YafN of YafNO toxin-antitoxin module